MDNEIPDKISLKDAFEITITLFKECQEERDRFKLALEFYRGNFDGKSGSRWNGDIFFIEDKFGSTYPDQGEHARTALGEKKR